MEMEMSPPGHRNRAMPEQRRVRTRTRLRGRKELVLIQMCVFGGLVLLVKGGSVLLDGPGEFLIKLIGTGSVLF